MHTNCTLPFCAWETRGWPEELRRGVLRRAPPRSARPRQGRACSLFSRKSSVASDRSGGKLWTVRFRMYSSRFEPSLRNPRPVAPVDSCFMLVAAEVSFKNVADS